MKIPYVTWRGGRPRFIPGASTRALGFDGEDLHHDDGRWYSEDEARAWARTRHAEIVRAKGTGRRSLSATAPSKRMTGFVYFLRCGDIVKIGYSARPIKRIDSMLSGVGRPITMCGFVAAAPHHERLLHKAVDRYRTHREWFLYQPSVAKIVIRSLTLGRVVIEE